MIAAAPSTYVARVDRERRQHETAIVVYLLATFARAARHSLAAVRLGHDPIQAALDVIEGSDAIGQPGIAIGVERLLMGAYRAGWRRAHLEGERATLALDDERLPPLPPEARPSMAAYARGYAREAARMVRDGLTTAARGAARGVKAVLGAVRGWWRGSGLVVNKTAVGTGGSAPMGQYAGVPLGKGKAPTLPQFAGVPIGKAKVTPAQHAGTGRPGKAIAAGQTLAIGGYNAGSDAGYATIPVVLGMQFVAVLDDRTTEYCRPLDGVQLLIDDPRLKTIRCPRHWNCRSVLKPLFKDFTPTEDVPDIAPQAGFGSGYYPVT